MSDSLNIDKEQFKGFLLNQQEKYNQKKLTQSKLKEQDCFQLKNALEISINDMIVNNKSNSRTKISQLHNVDFIKCGLDKDLLKLMMFAKQTTNLYFDAGCSPCGYDTCVYVEVSGVKKEK
jgi:hypothetical protein